MQKFSLKNGFSVIELLVVIAVIGILVGMAGLLSTKFFARRAIDSVTYQLSSNLSLAKLQASRNGVEYQTECAYDAAKNEIALMTKRGNSNTNTDFTDAANYDVVTNEIIRIDENYTITPVNSNFRFNPNGTTDALALNIAPTVNANIIKCGSLMINTFGRISTVIGNWDFGANTCRAIADVQEDPS